MDGTHSVCHSSLLVLLTSLRAMCQCSTELNLTLVGLTLLNKVLLAKRLLHTLNLDETLIPGNGERELGPHLSINGQGEAPDQRSGNGNISHADVVVADEPSPALQVGLEAAQRALYALQVGSLGGLVVRLEVDAPQSELSDGLQDLTLREADPLADARALRGGGTEQLGGLGAALGDVLRDGVGLEQGGTVGALEGGDLAQRELGQEVLGLVGLAHGEVGKDGQLQAVQVGRSLGLSIERCQQAAAVESIDLRR